jgi:hypothetical protein
VLHLDEFRLKEPVLQSTDLDSKNKITRSLVFSEKRIGLKYLIVHLSTLPTDSAVFVPE